MQFDIVESAAAAAAAEAVLAAGAAMDGGARLPGNWDQMTETKRRNWYKNRRKRENKARVASLGLSRSAR